MVDFTALIRDVPDFPEPGIVFKDIMPLLADAEHLRSVVAALADPWRDASLTAVVGIEARGFLLGTPVAMALGVGFVAVRKAGKLPGPTVQETYGLEYGTDTIEIHRRCLTGRPCACARRCACHRRNGRCRRCAAAAPWCVGRRLQFSSRARFPRRSGAAR